MPGKGWTEKDALLIRNGFSGPSNDVDIAGRLCSHNRVEIGVACSTVTLLACNFPG